LILNCTTTYYYVLFNWRCMYVWYVLLNSTFLLIFNLANFPCQNQILWAFCPVSICPWIAAPMTGRSWNRFVFGYHSEGYRQSMTLSACMVLVIECLSISLLPAAGTWQLGNFVLPTAENCNIKVATSDAARSTIAWSVRAVYSQAQGCVRLQRIKYKIYF